MPRDPGTDKELPGTTLREKEYISMLSDQGQVMRFREQPSKEGRSCPVCGLEGEFIEWQQHRDVERPYLHRIRTNWICAANHRWDWGSYDARKKQY